MSPSPGCDKFDGRAPAPPDRRRDGADRRPRRAAQRDGTFGTLGRGRAGAFTTEEIAGGRGAPLRAADHLYWRDGGPTSLERRRADRQPRRARRRSRCCVQAPRGRRPRRAQAAGRRGLVATARAARERSRGSGRPASCPISARSAPEPHARFVGAIVPASERGAAAMSRTAGSPRRSRGSTRSQGDVDTLPARIAAIRTWTYIAHRADWLADPAHWAERAAADRGPAVRRAASQRSPSASSTAHHRAAAPDSAPIAARCRW